MTAEIAIMNRGAVALAADSAVTIDAPQGKKIFNTVNKLFVLSKYRPVGIMVYGRSDLMGVPWETIIKTYRQQLWKKSFDSVDGYGKDFITFLAQSRHLLPDVQRTKYFEFRATLEFLRIKDEIDQAVAEAIKKDGGISVPEVEKLVEKSIRDYRTQLEKEVRLTSIPTGVEGQLLVKYKDSIANSITGVLEKLPLSATAQQDLMEIASKCVTRDRFISGQHTGLVLAGFGESDVFPVVVTYLISGVVDGNAIYKHEPQKSGEVSHNSRAQIIPFAQSEMVTRFMTGVDPDYSAASASYIRNVLTRYPKIVVDSFPNLGEIERNELQKKLKEASDDLIKTYFSDMLEYRESREIQPILNAVASLPKDELAQMAESMIHITSLKRKVSLDADTVGGAIDVAVISKGDGLIWIKRKHYFEPQLNNQFFQNYYRKDEHGTT